MQVFESFGQLVDDESNMNIFEDSLRNHIMKIGLHELEEQVHVFVIISANGLKKPNYIWVICLAQDFDLTKSPLGISRMLEGVKYFLEGKYSFSWFFLYLPNMPVGSRADLFHNIEAP